LRYYRIEIRDDRNQIVKDNNNLPLQFTTLQQSSLTNAYRGQTTNPNALNVELDLQLGPQSQPTSNSFVRIWGVPLYLLNSAHQLAGNPNKKFFYHCRVYGGMWSGLPLSNPKQSGILTNGRIVQSFGNWQGTNQTLDLYLSPSLTTYNLPKNFTFSVKKGKKLSIAIRVALANVFPNTKIEIDISDNLIATQNLNHEVPNAGDFSSWINQLSKDIIKDDDYSGVEIKFYPSENKEGLISVTDNFTYFPEVKQINFNDLIGQPTWVAFRLISLKLVMRADLKVNDIILLPNQLDNLTVIANPKAFGYQGINGAESIRKNTIFNNTFRITSLRHVGNYRQPDENSWCTIIEASPTAGFQ